MDSDQPPLGDLSGSPSQRSRQNIPASLKISSFLNFQKQPQPSPIRRKPLPPGSILSPKKRSRDDGPPSELLTLRTFADIPPDPPSDSEELMVRDLDQFPRGHTPLIDQGDDFPGKSTGLNGKPLPLRDNEQGRGRNNHARLVSEPQQTKKTMMRPGMQRAITTAVQPSGNPPARFEPPQRSFSGSSVDPKAPKTPVGNKLTSFFTWKNSSPGSDSTSTEASDHGHSSIPSPNAPSPQTSYTSMRSNGLNIDVGKANAGHFRDGGLGPPLPPPTAEGDLFRRVSQLEAELREISAELAGSIRREMDLEDLVEKLQSDAPQPPDYNQRTSDYFSDSGTSSVRYQAEPSVRLEDIESVKRKSEQERAQLKVTLSQKWQDERSRRKVLEAHVQILEDKINQSRRDRTENSNATAKAKELEISLEDARRRLVEERKLKENFEDLLTALRVDLEQHRNERDNLRDEVVPQLRSQLQGYESAATESSKMNYDHARLQQEVDRLRSENSILINARKMQQDMQRTQAGFSTISEEGETRPQSPIGLSRSNSLARGPSRATGLARSGSLSRSNSITGKGREPPESLVDRIKDIEMQRDALHKGMKQVLERQKVQTREYEKRIKNLEIERDRAMQSSSPRTKGYEKEVKSLRAEINHLRTRADDAVEQKFQCEKGLGGLKMDLDRAEQETASLRKLLQEHDISLPEDFSAQLEAAYSDLQRERQQVQSRVDSFRSIEEEQRLAAQLSASAQRSEVLAAQMRQQLDTNQSLRLRLASAISKGETSQQASTRRISELQARLKKLEDTVVVAQQQSETAVMKHEEEIRTLKDSHNVQLQRVKSGLRTPTIFSPKSPASPLFSSRSPKLDKTSSGVGMPLNQALKTEWLEKKVKELEAALGDADKEMEEVVSRMNMAQIEVAELQAERDEALRQTRRLEAEISAEREKVKALMEPLTSFS
ncbi:MAG: hypothetical protein Q9227_000767 [Pyrenula ochraceoflavens]